jgi:hypothetical protein
VKVAVAATKGGLTFTATPAEGEGVARNGSLLRRTSWWVELPDGAAGDDVHPDLLALAALVCLRPFIARGLQMDRPVSEAFAGTTGGSPRVTPVDPGLAPRHRGPRPGLAFSGGVDSTAALSLLPDDAVAVFMQRKDPLLAAAPRPVQRLARFAPVSYTAGPALGAVALAVATGRTALAMRSDVEWARRPAGFATDFTPALPSIVAAEHLGLGSLAMGTVFESAYWVGHSGYFWDYDDRPHSRRWHPSFEAVGMPLDLTTAGLSEVATDLLAKASPLGAAAQSCVRGAGGCLQCFKCFRATVLTAAATGDWPEDDALTGMMRVPEVAGKLRELPIHHENVFAHAFAAYQGTDPLIRLLRTRLGCDELELGWMRRWYGPSAAILPDHRREATAAALEAAGIETMSEDDEAAARAWHAGDRLEAPAGAEAARRFLAAFDA